MDYPEKLHVKLDLGMVGTGRWTSAGTENPFDETPYIRADIHGERMRAVIAEREEARSTISKMMRTEADHLEAIAILAGAGNVSPAELVQLGVGRVIQNPMWKEGDDPRNRYAFSVLDLNDLRDMNENAMRQQATTAKFRQIKQHFKAHQQSVSYVLDHIQKIMGKNQITGQDRDDLRNLRDQLTDLAGRKV